MTRLDRYILGECLLPFLLGSGVATFILIFDFLFPLMDLLVGKGTPVILVGRLVALALGSIVALSIPCGVLVGSLMTFGRLSQENEITALRACGVHPGRTVSPVFLAAGLVAVSMTLFNNFVLPGSNRRLMATYREINRINPTNQIREGVFMDDFPGISLIVGHVDQSTGSMHDIVIYDFSRSETPVTILADSGRLSSSQDGSTLRFDLENGEIHEVLSEIESGQYRRIRYEHFEFFLPGADTVTRSEDPPKTDREMTVEELLDHLRILEAKSRNQQAELAGEYKSLGILDDAEYRWRVLPPETGFAGFLERLRLFQAKLAGRTVIRTRIRLSGEDESRIRMARLAASSTLNRANALKVEIHKKFSLPASCLVFVLLGTSIGILVRRGGFGSAVYSIGFFVAYWMLLIEGERLADRSTVDPALAMWAPNMVMAIPALWLTWRTIRGRDMRPH